MASLDALGADLFQLSAQLLAAHVEPTVDVVDFELSLSLWIVSHHHEA
jgi:hypothetical protein